MNKMTTNEVARYKNEVNHIPMRKWTSEEMNFFFAVLTRMRDEETNLVIMNKYELAELANYSINSNKSYKHTMSTLANKVSDLKYWKQSANSLVTMPLFTYFNANWTEDLNDMTVEIEVNNRFKYILNEWNEGNWTQFMLNEFTAIHSTYSKSLFRLLKQWRTKGVREFSIDEFKQLMDVPKSYSSGMITSRIINNALEDLRPYFNTLKVKVIKSNKRGNPIIGFRFTWRPEKTGQWIEDKYKNTTEYSGSINKPNKEQTLDRNRFIGDDEELKKQIEQFRNS